MDVGCGDGLLLSLLGEKGTGIDFSHEAVHKAREKGLNTILSDISKKLPFPDNAFDTVIALDILEHLLEPELVVKEMVRVARRDIIIGVPNFSSLPARLQTVFGSVPENNTPKKGHTYWFNYHVLLELLEKNGLTVSEIRFNTPRGLPNILPNLFGLSFVVRALKE